MSEFPKELEKKEYEKLSYENVSKVKITSYEKTGEDFEFFIGMHWRGTKVQELKVYENGDVGVVVKGPSGVDEPKAYLDRIRGTLICDGKDYKKKYRGRGEWFGWFKDLEEQSDSI